MFSHRFHRFTPNFLAEKNSVKSVDSVGDIHALTSVIICEICGSLVNYKRRAVSQGPEHEKINLFLLICSPTDFSFWWDILPQISQIYTELSCWEKFCEICGFCGSFFNYKLRVDSVGDIRALTSVRICEICGSFFNYKPRVKSVGVFSTTNLEWILWGFSTTNFRQTSVTASWEQRYSGAVTI